ncbi:DNA polymerase III subunit gamma/tau [Sphingomonas sp.]|uniref:DNA polymerase III subunit gamma/tau n=1 Tax=Sphingomonas sp. TaxID=28214 RepID=UPI0025D96B3B|nr:DNA polymerase III subunit gamma/tau [Sphingomonas sp.]
MSSTQPYRVLARKYRPQTFAELIGQDAMVTTLGNAIKRDRLAHAFLLTGVRGVGKTSTARLIAKALNCIGPDGTGGPTIAPCGTCEPCVAIAEGRHIDVIEMDAASNTGVDDVREIIDGVRYASVSARYKVYIVDEVHMLSKNAFNALLKTLEEPPPHVKFLFATTEVNKVPVTVLSRCQRFDLRRIPSDLLGAHFAMICDLEKVEAEPEALALIARAAEGSVRDGLSILDQAIAHADLDTDNSGAGGMVTAVQLRDMLGLSDRGALRRLFGLVLTGDGPGVLAALAEQHNLGVDPTAVLRGLLEIVHATTIQKVGAPNDPAQSAEERNALKEWATGLSFALLHRLWQLLLKGHDEVARATDPREAADMALLRVVHASTLPDPADLARKLESGVALSSPQPTTPAAPVLPQTFEALIQIVEKAGKFLIAQRLRDEVGLIRYAPPELAIRPNRPFDTRELGQVLKEATGIIWQVATEDSPAQPTIREQELATETATREAVLAQPVVRAAFEHFPDAELIGWSEQRSATP